jgi:hypothetical protein
MLKNIHGNTVDPLGEAIVAGRYATGADIAEIEEARIGMRHAAMDGGDYVTNYLCFTKDCPASIDPPRR